MFDRLYRIVITHDAALIVQLKHLIAREMAHVGASSQTSSSVPDFMTILLCMHQM